MLATALLFSGEETSRPLIQALEEMEISVHYCPEIFGAIKELTARSFDVIVADLDDGPEAEFLLKTARELKLSRQAFILAVAEANTAAVGASNWADLLITKPLIPEQIKYSLLMCDRFLVGMREWIAKPGAAARVQPASQRNATSVSPLTSLRLSRNASPSH